MMEKWSVGHKISNEKTHQQRWNSCGIKKTLKEMAPKNQKKKDT